MRWLLDLCYLIGAVATAIVWLPRMIATGKIRTDWRGKFGHAPSLGSKSRPRILLHAVSVGEVNAIRLLADRLAASPQRPHIIIATTTDTGFKRASELWKDRHRVVRYPLDFSWAVSRFLKTIQPDVVVLVELEVWPNFTAECQRRDIPVCVVNGRLTERSFRRYRMVGRLIQPSFSRLSGVAAQNGAYAQRFAGLGVRADRVVITGTMKWDTAQIADQVPGAEELAREMGIDRSKPLVVAGSTAPDEHQLLLKSVPKGVQLLCAPRKPEWFDQAATVLDGCVRRSRGERGSPSGGERFLLDTIGELRMAYALADVVVVGRSFGDLHGSDMMEPIALGKATIVGPAVADFQDTMDALIAGNGVVQSSIDRLGKDLNWLLSDSQARKTLADNGRAVIRQNQGATDKTAEIILDLLRC